MAEPDHIEEVAFDILDQRFPERRMLAGFEGGAVYEAEADDAFVLITSEGTLSEFLDDADLHLVSAATAYFFRSISDRDEYSTERGWSRRRHTYGFRSWAPRSALR